MEFKGGAAEMSRPPSYPHVCSKCDARENIYGDSFPRIEYSTEPPRMMYRTNVALSDIPVADEADISTTVGGKYKVTLVSSDGIKTDGSLAHTEPAPKSPYDYKSEFVTNKQTP